jgi:hypothetical protein
MQDRRDRQTYRCYLWESGAKVSFFVWLTISIRFCIISSSFFTLKATKSFRAIGCAERREAHRSRLIPKGHSVRLLTSAHPPLLLKMGETGKARILPITVRFSLTTRRLGGESRIIRLPLPGMRIRVTKIG